MKDKMKGHMGKKSGGHLHDGLTDKAPSGHDASMTMKAGHVDDGAIRSSTAPTPRTMGPRTA